MPFTTGQLESISRYMLPTDLKKKPIDQITADKPLFNWLMKNKEEWGGAGGAVTEPLRITNDSNGQDYFGADQVSFNSRDPIRRTNWRWFNYFQGFGFDEDTLQAAGIVIDDDSDVVATIDEKYRLSNLYGESIESMRLGTQEDLDLRFHLNGAQSTKAAPGLDYLVALDPTIGTVGGLNAATFDFWRNNTELDINVLTPANGNINAAMKAMSRANMLYGGHKPDAIFAGLAYLEQLEKENRAIHHVNIDTTGRTGTDFDGAVKMTRFDGVEVQWDPTFEKLDELYGPLAQPWTNRCYMLFSGGLRLRPIKGQWMKQTKPKRPYDRFVHYTGMKAKYAFTTGQRNAQAVLSVDV